MSMPRAGRRVAAALIVALCVSVGTSVRAQSEGLVEDGESPGLLLMYTGDVIGYIDPCG